MAQNARCARSRFGVFLASMGALALASCTSGPGGIVVDTDSGGARDSASDQRESGASGTAGAGGAAGAMPDSAADALSDVSDDRSGDSGIPPICVFHTPPPAAYASFDDSGADVTADMTADSTADAIADVFEAGAADSGADTGSADVTTSDGGGQDGPVVADASSGDGPSSPDAIDDSTTGTDARGDRSGGRDGGGADAGDPGDAGPPPSITIRNSPFLGPYLADSAGRTLYTFGNDKAGDCMSLPIPDCEADCAIAWPPFDAGERTLAMGLDPNVFGSVTRPDGMSQITTYYGWPLYYYRSDTTSGVINGQGKSKTWHVATVIPHNMMIMRDKTNPRYIADGNGRTLYVFDQDTVGTETSDPVSACVGDCQVQHPPFLLNRLNAVTSLDPNDLSLFVRPDNGRQQVAYQGAPLYLSAMDARSGDQNGVAMGWTVAAAP